MGAIPWYTFKICVRLPMEPCVIHAQHGENGQLNKSRMCVCVYLEIKY